MQSSKMTACRHHMYFPQFLSFYDIVIEWIQKNSIIICRTLIIWIYVFYICMFILKYLMLRWKLRFWLTWGSKSSNPTNTLFHEKVPATVSFGNSISKPGKVHISSEMHQERYQEGVQVHNGYCNEIPQVLYWLLVGNFSKQFEQCP